MTNTLADRYLAGEREAVWSSLNSFSVQFAPEGELREPDLDELRAVLEIAFTRAARSIDTIIERLRATGYRFECESGRNGPVRPPRRPVWPGTFDAMAEINERYAQIPGFEYNPPIPLAVEVFARVVGDVDLSQRYPPAPPLEIMTDLPEHFEFKITPEMREILRIIEETSERIKRRGIQKDWPRRWDLTEEEAAAITAEDALPHPRAEDPVVARLGDWDPLVIEFSHIATRDPSNALQGLVGGGLGHDLEFAPSFEHKADMSGVDNPTIVLPNIITDPLVQAEAIDWVFSRYLRHALANGGFLGVPRAVRAGQEALMTREVAPGLFLPDHPIFAELADGLDHV